MFTPHGQLLLRLSPPILGCSMTSWDYYALPMHGIYLQGSSMAMGSISLSYALTRGDPVLTGHQ
jgi:hypothetical protein